MTKSGILGSVVIGAFIGAMALAPVAGNASTPSSPAEKAATAELNRKIAAANAESEARAKAAEAQYQEQMKQHEEQQRVWEQQQQQYLAQLKGTGASPDR